MMLDDTSASSVYALYPVLMQRAYGVVPDVSSLGFAVAAALGLAIYSPAGRWSKRFAGYAALPAIAGIGPAATILASLPPTRR